MAGIYGSNSSGAASPYGAPRPDMPNGQAGMNRLGVPQGPSYGGMQSPGRPQGPAYGQNPKALAAALSTMAPQMGSHVMPNGSMMPNSAMPAPMGAPMMPPMGAPMSARPSDLSTIANGRPAATLSAIPTMPAATQPQMPAQMPMMGNPADPMAAQRLRDRQMAGVMQ